MGLGRESYLLVQLSFGLLSYGFCRQAAEGETHWSFAMDATDASFSKFMTTAIDLPSRAVSFWALLMERAFLDASTSYFRVLS